MRGFVQTGIAMVAELRRWGPPKHDADRLRLGGCGSLLRRFRYNGAHDPMEPKWM